MYVLPVELPKYKLEDIARQEGLELSEDLGELVLMQRQDKLQMIQTNFSELLTTGKYVDAFELVFKNKGLLSFAPVNILNNCGDKFRELGQYEFAAAIYGDEKKIMEKFGEQVFKLRDENKKEELARLIIVLSKMGCDNIYEPLQRFVRKTVMNIRRVK
ncbi:hypothetical protein HOK51_06855 [Candidatus Woesearchaeota archaeon]|jgi:hypothetical protein|nr:hypothetical protein [Candidatus Woesearchaeota archaeon]MBT6519542.1 hypothetical protein [Candidatus Woesearchaeota archaeon]MBT7367713.1 hypothetical protein [Candidatus Woesearchaeota archaeon]